MSNQISLKQEIWRKSNHLLIAILPISYIFLSKFILLCAIIPVCLGIIIADFWRQKNEKVALIFNKIFGKILREHEKNNLCGASYFSFAALVIFGFFPKIIAINAFLILAICDSLAAIIGRSMQTRPFFEKSVAGSLAFFISALVIIGVTGAIFKQDILYYLFGAIAIVVTTIIEARPSLLNLDDNITIPFAFSLTLLAFNTIWIYN